MGPQKDHYQTEHDHASKTQMTPYSWFKEQLHDVAHVLRNCVSSRALHQYVKTFRMFKTQALQHFKNKLQ